MNRWSLGVLSAILHDFVHSKSRAWNLKYEISTKLAANEPVGSGTCQAPSELTDVWSLWDNLLQLEQNGRRGLRPGMEHLWRVATPLLVNPLPRSWHAPICLS